MSSELGGRSGYLLAGPRAAHSETQRILCRALGTQNTGPNIAKDELTRLLQAVDLLVGAAGLQPATLCLEVCDSCPILLILMDVDIGFSGSFVFLRRLLNNSLHNFLF
jgi:hypothetical protein